MLNRRHLRIKVLQALYAFTQSDNKSLTAGEKELLHSIDKMYDLYIMYLLILPELKFHAERKSEERKRKIIQTEESLNPVRNFIDNKMISLLEDNLMLQRKSEEIKMNWVGDVNQDLIKKLFIQIESSELYIAFMAIENPDFDQQKDFTVKLFKREICNSPILLNHFEEMRIHWQDDFDHVFGMSLKTLKNFTSESDELTEIFNLYKDDEEEFASKLFTKSVTNFESYTELLGKYTKNWDSDRLAKMDIFIMVLAITEAKEFSSIPLKVSMNEYIEISKFYSTPKSNSFINGVLDKLFGDLQKDGSIRKVGRGLV